MRRTPLIPYLIFFVLLLIPFSVYFARPNIIGNDGYAYLMEVCQKTSIIKEDNAFFLLLGVIPCNILAIKVLLFFCAFVSGCFIIKMAILFSPKNGWMACFLVFLSSTIVLEFAKFENDTFAFPILFASLFFFYHGMKNGNRKSWLAAFALLVPAGLLWQGSFFLVVGYALTVWMLWFPLVLLMIFHKPFHPLGILGQIMRTNKVLEDMPFQFHTHFIANFGLFGALMEPILFPQALFFFLMGVASAKFWILSLPFLVVGMVLLIEKAKMPTANTFFAVVSLIMVAALAQSVWTNPPTQDHWTAIDYALEIDNNVQNDWGMGYWVKWRGGQTDSYSTFHRQSPFEESVVITEQDLNCQLLKGIGQIKVYFC